MFELTYQELWWVSVIQPIIISFTVALVMAKVIAYLRKRKLAKEEAGRIEVGCEVKLHTGPHEGKEGLVIARLTLITQKGVHTEQAAVITETGELLVGEPLTNLEKVS